MNEKCKPLKEKVDQFIHDAMLAVKHAREGETHVSKEDIENLANKIHALRQSAEELLGTCSDDENLYLNAKIIRDLTEGPILFSKEENREITLIQAADLVKQKSNDSDFKKLLITWSQQPILSEVFFDDLKLISRELAA